MVLSLLYYTVLFVSTQLFRSPLNKVHPVFEIILI